MRPPPGFYYGTLFNMANVLPRHDRETLRKNYRLRLLTTTALVLTGAMVVGIVSLIPAYLSAQEEAEQAQRYKDIQSETRTVSKDDDALIAARYVRSQIEQAQNAQTSIITDALVLTLRDWEVHANDIIISGISFRYTDEKAPRPELRLSGRARSRATLNAFVQTLKQDPAFLSVTLPVSDLAESDESTFSVVIILKS